MELTAEKRNEKGKEVKALRRRSLIPSVLIEKLKDSVDLSVKENDFQKVYREAGETALVDLAIAGGSTQKVLIDDVQLHPITLKPIHVVFRKVDLLNKITVTIPVEVINDEQNPFVKSKEAMVLTLLDEIEVEALPGDLPQAFIVDALKLTELGMVLTVADLTYDHTKVEVVSHGLEEPVVKLDEVREQAEEPEITEEEALSQVTATEELTDEQKQERAAAKKAESEDTE